MAGCTKRVVWFLDPVPARSAARIAFKSSPGGRDYRIGFQMAFLCSIRKCRTGMLAD